MHSDFLLVIVVAAALAFDFTNGFHDTANVVASTISTRALSPRTAVAIASILNFAGAFISLKVAATIATGIIDTGKVTETIAFAGLLGAITWNLMTWYYGLPSSSSHALIGGVVGAMIASGSHGVKWQGVASKVVVPALIAPVLAFCVAGLSIFVVYRLVGHRRPGLVSRGFRLGQVVSGSMLSLAQRVDHSRGTRHAHAEDHGDTRAGQHGVEDDFRQLAHVDDRRDHARAASAIRPRRATSMLASTPSASTLISTGPITPAPSTS